MDKVINNILSMSVENKNHHQNLVKSGVPNHKIDLKSIRANRLYKSPFSHGKNWHDFPKCLF